MPSARLSSAKKLWILRRFQASRRLSSSRRCLFPTSKSYEWGKHSPMMARSGETPPALAFAVKISQTRFSHEPLPAFTAAQCLSHRCLWLGNSYRKGCLTTSFGRKSPRTFFSSSRSSCLIPRNASWTIGIFWLSKSCGKRVPFPLGIFQALGSGCVRFWEKVFDLFSDSVEKCTSQNKRIKSHPQYHARIVIRKDFSLELNSTNYKFVDYVWW